MKLKSRFSSFWNYVKKNKKISIPAVIILIVLAIVFRPKAPAVIESEKVSRGDIVVSISGTGIVTSETSVNLSFLSSGKLTYLGVKEGDRVSPYQVIATLDQRSVEKNLQTTLRDYAKARNTFEQTKQNNGNATPQTAVNDQMKRVLENNQYDLDKAVISVELQDIARDNSVLTTPIGGIVTRADVQTAGVNISPTTIFTIADPDHLLFDIDIDEADIGKISLNNTIEAHLDAFPDEAISLSISSIDFASHATSTGGTVYTVHAALPINGNGQYRTGMSGDADVILQKRTNVLRIPISSLSNGDTVYVKNGKKYEKRTVTLGLRNDIDVEVRSGLQEGEVIATQPDQVSATQK